MEGHTDNIGGDPYNLDLSQRRAEAVKLALDTRYHIAANRLTPQGFGATRPEQVRDNAGASGVKLGADILERIDGILGPVIQTDPSRTASPPRRS